MGYFTIRITWLSRDINEFEIFVRSARGGAEDAITENSVSGLEFGMLIHVARAIFFFHFSTWNNRLYPPTLYFTRISICVV
jgi:hypothetical protein